MPLPMTRLIRPIGLGACAIAAALFGCTNLTDDSTAQGAEVPELPEDPTTGMLELYFHLGDGDRPADAAFDAKDAVYLRTRYVADAGRFSDGDLAFVVVDAQGRQLSTDALDCRRFRVTGATGRITEVHAGVELSGASCQHNWGWHDDGSLMPRLIPFADAEPGPSGDAAYTVLVARVEDLVEGVFPEDAFRATFTVDAEESGECCEGGACCGNGHLDPGEDCDDGNTAAGDGCSPTCHVEIIN
jgi:cysteine-rich repeat protein